jgi:hypothetical protein
MRPLNPILLGAIFFIAGPLPAGETASKDTIAFLQKLQTPKGGFLPAATDASSIQPSLRATSAAVRALHYMGGAVPEKATCVEFVDRCFDPKIGAFSDSPGGKADLFVTAVGVMAIVELKMPTEKYAPAAIQYLSENAKTFEEIRLAAAAFESLGKEAPRKEHWLKEIRKMTNADGTFGDGAGKARATGGAAAAILRLGGKVDRDAVLKALKQGQFKSGGFGNDDSADLETTYRVMRTFMMLKSRPDDVAGLESFLVKCRNRDGGYGVAPGQASTAAGTYYAASIQHWLKR